MTNNKLKHLIYGSAFRVTVRKGRKVWWSSETEHFADQDNASKLNKTKQKKVEKFKNNQFDHKCVTNSHYNQIHKCSTDRHKNRKCFFKNNKTKHDI